MDKECSICLEVLTGEVMETACGHVFHKSCFDGWLEVGVTCPLCRKSVNELLPEVVVARSDLPGRRCMLYGLSLALLMLMVVVLTFAVDKRSDADDDDLYH